MASVEDLPTGNEVPGRTSEEQGRDAPDIDPQTSEKGDQIQSADAQLSDQQGARPKEKSTFQTVENAKAKGIAESSSASTAEGIAESSGASTVKGGAESSGASTAEGVAESSGSEGIQISDSCLDSLSQGLLDALLPHFQKHDESLAEFTRNQVLLIETLQQENQKFTEDKLVSDLTKMMLEAKQYQLKLTAMKKEMSSLHEKSTKLKKRALKLQQQKMKENLEREQQREREIEEDRKLAAKRPTPSASTKTDPHR